MPARSLHCVPPLLLLLLGLSFAVPAAAELSSADLNTALIKARDEAREALLNGIKDTRDKTDKEFDAVKGDLPKAWKEGVDKAVQAFESELNLHRIAILDLLKEEPSRVAPVAAALKDYSDAVSAALKEGAETLETQAKEFAETFDSEATDAKVKALEKFDELAAGIPKKLDPATAGQAVATVQQATETPSATSQLTSAKAEIKKLAQQAELDEYNELRKQIGFSRIVRCVYSEDSPRLACAPDLLISAAEISDIEISNLPANKEVTISALVAREKLSDTAVSDCVASSKGLDVSCSQIRLPVGKGGAAFVSIYKNRLISPKYGGIFGNMNQALSMLRPEAYQEYKKNPSHPDVQALLETSGSRMSLLVSGGAAQIMVRVQIGDGTGAGQLATASIPIGYARFSVESGGFFAVTKLSDAQLVQAPDPIDPKKVKILRIDSGNDYSQETGISLGFVPRNYPAWAMAVGFSTSGDRPVSAFLGPSFRLRTFGQRGLASFSSGVALKSVKRFPGISADASYDATDPRLNGRDGYKLGAYVMLQLGFAFGPIPGPDNGNSEAPK